MVSAIITAMLLQAAPLAAAPPPRAATADECAVALQTLRHFLQRPGNARVQGLAYESLSLAACPGGQGPTDAPSVTLLILELDPARGVARLKYGRCLDNIVALVRRDDGWIVESAEPIEDACGELYLPPRSPTKRR